jgi:hypothetical protein
MGRFIMDETRKIPKDSWDRAGILRGLMRHVDCLPEPDAKSLINDIAKFSESIFNRFVDELTGISASKALLFLVSQKSKLSPAQRCGLTQKAAEGKIDPWIIKVAEGKISSLSPGLGKDLWLKGPKFDALKALANLPDIDPKLAIFILTETQKIESSADQAIVLYGLDYRINSLGKDAFDILIKTIEKLSRDKDTYNTYKSNLKLINASTLLKALEQQEQASATREVHERETIASITELAKEELSPEATQHICKIISGNELSSIAVKMELLTVLANSEHAVSTMGRFIMDEMRRIMAWCERGQAEKIEQIGVVRGLLRNVHCLERSDAINFHHYIMRFSDTAYHSLVEEFIATKNQKVLLYLVSHASGAKWYFLSEKEHQGQIPVWISSVAGGGC